MSTGNVMPVPQQQFCDINGNPYALGSLTFYAAGTTTPLDTYFNSDLAPGHENTNPLTLDGSGRAIVYFKSAAYRVILKDADGATVYDQDDVYGVDVSVWIGNQTANTFFAGPASGSAAPASFRAIVPADIAAVLTTTSTGTQNDFAPGTLAPITLVRCNNATLLTITGLAAGVSGQQVWFASIGAGQVDFSHQAAGSTAANRLINFASETTAPTSLAAGVGVCGYEYDATTLRWRLIAHEQGDYIDYAATSTIVGWSAFTTKVIRYKLSGRQLNVISRVEGTSNSTSTTFTLPYKSVNLGFSLDFGLFIASDNGGSLTAASYTVSDNSTTVTFNKDVAGTAWTNSGTKLILVNNMQVDVQ